MTMSNIQTAQKPRFDVMITQSKFQKAINNTLQDPNRARSFTSSIISAVSTNPSLQECDTGTIVNAALLGESLNLSPSPQLGQYYLVPFNDKKRDCKVAQFQLGYKGYLQLAMRSGHYRKINVLSIKEGELIKYDPLEEEIQVNLIDDEEQREKANTIGYYAMFEYHNGFRKALYWSKKKMMCHADKYSQAFSLNGSTFKSNGKTITKVSFEEFEKGNYPPEDAWLYSSFWYKDFDGMAYKTMLRQLISKWGIMSVDLQEAFVKDMGVINDDSTVEYVENPSFDDEVIIPQEEPTVVETKDGLADTSDDAPSVSLDDI